jgi:hypothetical protein
MVGASLLAAVAQTGGMLLVARALNGLAVLSLGRRIDSFFQADIRQIDLAFCTRHHRRQAFILLNPWGDSSAEPKASSTASRPAGGSNDSGGRSFGARARRVTQ